MNIKIILAGILAYGAYDKYTEFKEAKEITELAIVTRPEIKALEHADAQGKSSIVVFGSKICGLTDQTKKMLADANLNYTYVEYTDQTSSKYFFNRMEQSNVDVRKYHLPIVEVNGEFLSQPDIHAVKAAL